MNDSELSIPEEILPEVLALAARLYSEQKQGRSAEALAANGEVVAEGDIPPALIRQAFREIQAQRFTARKRPKKLQVWQKKLAGILGWAGVVAGFWGFGSWNALAWGEREVEAAWLQVENQLARSVDLIPKLANAAPARAKKEKLFVDLLVQSRQRYLQAQGKSEKIEAIAALSLAVMRLNRYIKNNPQGQFDPLFLYLQNQLAERENSFSEARSRYNRAVEAYSEQLQSFPNNLTATFFGFEPQPLLPEIKKSVKN